MKFILNYVIPYKRRQLIKRNLLYLKNWYTGVYCPVCKSVLEKFEPAGVIPRENAECPVCLSRERHRLLYLYIKKNKLLVENDKPIKLLHFAPENCFFHLFKEITHITYVPCDLHPKDYEYLGEPAIVKADITAIPFEANTFDIILCNHVLEHIEDDRKALSELYRVMKPSGKGFFLIPLDDSIEKTFEDFSITMSDERQLAFGQWNHVRICGKDYFERFTEAGFKVNFTNFEKKISQNQKRKYGLLGKESIYLAVKS